MPGLAGGRRWQARLLRALHLPAAGHTLLSPRFSDRASPARQNNASRGGNISPNQTCSLPCRTGYVYRGSVLLKNSNSNASLVMLNTTAFALVGSASPDVPLLLPNGTSPGTAHVDAAVSGACRAMLCCAVLCWVACSTQRHNLLIYQKSSSCVRVRVRACTQSSAWAHAGGFSCCSHL